MEKLTSQARRPLSYNEHWIFGEIVDEPMNPELLRDILERARKLKVKLKLVPIKIMYTFDEIAQILSEDVNSWRESVLNSVQGTTGYSRQMAELALDELLKQWNFESSLLKFRLETGFTAPQLRFGDWTFEPYSNLYVKLAPYGVMVHITAGNVILGVLDSLYHGLLGGNVNVVKLPSSVGLRGFLPLLELLKELAPDIADKFALISFKGGTTELERLLASYADSVVVWGGWEAVKKWRELTPPNIPLKLYGPRYSFSIIDWEYFKSLEPSKRAELLNALSLDVIIWEGKACASPQVIVLLNSTAENCRQFIDEFAEYLDAISEAYPPANVDIDDGTELMRHRELVFWTMHSVDQRTYIRCADDNSWCLMTHLKDKLPSAPGYRYVYVKPVENLGNLLKLLEGIRGYLQSVSVIVKPTEMLKLTERLASIGVYRVTGVGNIGKVKVGETHEGEYQLRTYFELKTLADDSTDNLFRPAVELEEYEQRVEMVMSELVKFAIRRSEFYRNFYSTLKLEDIELREFSWESLPTLESEHIRLHGPAGDSSMLTRELKGAYVFSTGGTTGKPKYCAYSHQEFEEVAEILANVYSLAGIDEGDTVANVFFAGNMWTSFIAVNKALEALGCNVLPISGNTPVERIVEILLSQQVHVLMGIPTVLLDIASYIDRNAIDIEIPKILYAGEFLTSSSIELLRDVFGTRIIRSAGYASVDAGPIGFQCPNCPDRVHHVIPYIVHVEILSPETSEPVSEGELVVTSLLRNLMPIIRYRTGDLARWVEPGSCGCGRNLPTFELLGRVGERFRIASADLSLQDIESAISKVNQIFDTRLLNNIYQIQLYEPERGKGYRGMRIILECNTMLQRELELDIAQRFLQELAELNWQFREVLESSQLELEVKLVPAGSLPRNPRTGKLKRVIYL